MKLWIDSASSGDVERYNKDPYISGFTTNSTLLANAGVETVKDYLAMLRELTDKPISIDTFTSNKRWPGFYLKIKVPTDGFLPMLDNGDLHNFTAVCTTRQVSMLDRARPEDVISVFAGRIMDTGRSPEPVIRAAKATGAQVLWASSRSVYDIRLAERFGCDIITLTPAIYEKYRAWWGKPLELVADETIAQFDADGEKLRWE